MPDPLPPSILCPVLIGRDAQVAALVRLLEQACAGQGQIALISGEAGIGKSRLVAECQRLAAQAGFAIWQGNCFEIDHALPYAPWLDLLRSLRQQMTLPPEVDRLFSAQPTAADSDPTQEKHRRFATLVDFLSQPPASRLLILEDLHWCDELSLEFLLQLSHRIRQQPVLVLLTYRNDEVSDGLGRLLAALNRARLAVEIPLTRLTAAETAAMLQGIFVLPRPSQSEFATLLYALTEGNPFFVEEVLKACVAEGAIFQTGGQWGRKPLNQIAIPPTVQIAVQQRVTRLTAAAQRLLTLAAVAGQRCDFDLLQQASGQDEGALIELLKELRTAQLLIEDAADHFSFRHALTRQTVYNHLLARERRLLHRTVAETLEALSQPTLPQSAQPIAALAYHFEAATLWQKTLHYARLASAQAQSWQAPAAVVDQCGRALRAAQQLGAAPPLDLLRQRGRAWEMLGDFAAARSDLEAVLTAAQANTDQPAQWQALLDLGFLWTSRDFAQAGAYFQQALTLARTLGDPSTLAHTLNRIGNWHVNMGQPHEGRSHHAEALALFQHLDDPAGVAATLDLLAGATHFGGDLRLGMAYYRQAAEQFRALGDRRGLVSALSWLAFQGATALNWMNTVAPLADCLQVGTEALQIAGDIQWRPGAAFALIALAFVRSAQGDYGTALALANEALALTQELQHGWATVAGIALGSIYLDLGAFSAAQQQLEQSVLLSQQWNIGMGVHNATSFLALAQVRQGAVTAAEALLTEKFGTLVLPKAAEQLWALTLKQRLYWAVRAELALQVGDVAQAIAIATALIESTQRHDDDSAPIVAKLWLLRGQAEIANQQLDRAIATLQRARQAAIVQATRPILWRVEALLGQLQQQRAERSSAEAHFAAARSVIETLATTLHDPAQREHFLYYALAHLPAAPPITPLRAAKELFDGLTERERAVAALIAQGKSDRAIAEQLVVSKRTASTHVTNILNKLGFSSRSQIAAWAIGKKLGS